MPSSAVTRPPGARLPPTRELARRLAVGRNTVINAYEQLTAEGYVEGRIGSGTRVGAEMPVDAKPVTAVVRAAVAPTRADAPQRTARPSLFRIDEPAFDSFPFETMRRLVTNRMRDDFAGVLRNDDPQGYEPLRRAITRYVTAERGIACSASQVVITAGSLHGLDLVARALSMTGETACVENPGDIAALGQPLGRGSEAPAGTGRWAWLLRRVDRFKRPGGPARRDHSVESISSRRHDDARAPAIPARMVGPERSADLRGRCRQRVPRRDTPAGAAEGTRSPRVGHLRGHLLTHSPS